MKMIQFTNSEEIKKVVGQTVLDTNFIEEKHGEYLELILNNGMVLMFASDGCWYKGGEKEVKEKIQFVDRETANEIVEERNPFGLFISCQKGTYVGIDNTTGDAWCEDFKSQEKCCKWLRGERT